MNVSTQSFKGQPYAGNGLAEDEISILKATFSRFDCIKKALLFGSRAMGNHKKGSDVDLALVGTVDEDILFRVRDALDDSPLPYFFDVIVYDEIKNGDLKKHIDEYGRVIYGD